MHSSVLGTFTYFRFYNYTIIQPLCYDYLNFAFMKSWAAKSAYEAKSVHNKVKCHRWISLQWCKTILKYLGHGLMSQ